MVALRLLQWRQARGVSQEEVAEVLDIRQPSYCKIEQGDTTLSAETALELVEYFGKSLDELLRPEYATPGMPEAIPVRPNQTSSRQSYSDSNEQIKEPMLLHRTSCEHH